jgi:hypothetical protein
MLDLGALGDIAEVGTLWKRPYQIDISTAVRFSGNVLEVKIRERTSGEARS